MPAIWRTCPDNGRYPKATKPIKLLNMCHLMFQLDKWVYSLLWNYETFKYICNERSSSIKDETWTVVDQLAKFQAEFFSGIHLPGDFTVTLAVFSGRPDPKWTIRSTDPSYKEIAAQLQKAKNAKLTYQPEDMPARLGYKGFLVQDTMKKESDLIVGQNTVPLQQLLLKTMPMGIIPKTTLKSVSEEINKGKVSADVQVTKRFAPDYFPSWWNGNRVRLLNNNCYNYANDRATNTFAQPGRAFALQNGQIADIDDYDLQMNAAAVQAGAVNDGLQVVNVPRPPQGPFVQNPLPRVPKGPRHLVALVVDPGL